MLRIFVLLGDPCVCKKSSGFVVGREEVSVTEKYQRVAVAALKFCHG